MDFDQQRVNLSRTKIQLNYSTFVINLLLMSPLLGHRSSLWITQRRTGHNPPSGPSVDWWVLTSANAARTNGLTCLLKHKGARDNIFLVIHSKTDQGCLASTIARTNRGAIELLIMAHCRLLFLTRDN
jgi:hypothetical protein